MKKDEVFARQIQAARSSLLETALVAFTEDILGRVPNDDEISSNGLHVIFSVMPLTTYAKDGVVFNQFFVWAKKHAVAFGFSNVKDPIALNIVRVPDDAWPAALRAYITQYGTKKEGA